MEMAAGGVETTHPKDMLTAMKTSLNIIQYNIIILICKGRTQAASKKTITSSIWQRFGALKGAHTPPGLECMLSTQKQNLQT